jgi:hypothetical protein
VTITLIPEIPGDAPLGHNEFVERRREWIGRLSAEVPLAVQYRAAEMAPGRPIAHGGNDAPGSPAEWVSCELYVNGAGFYAHVVGMAEDQRISVDDEAAAITIACGLRSLAKHAVEVGAAGIASIRVSLVTPGGPPTNHRELGAWTRSEEKAGRPVTARRRRAKQASLVQAMANEGDAS